jgi:hypothetical protein
MRVILITNILKENICEYKDIEIIHFNPWGFSKSNIEKQISAALYETYIPSNVLIKYCIKDLFFGRRSQIALEKIRQIYPKNEIIRIEENQINLILNNFSI